MADYLIENGCLPRSDRAIYVYGMKQMVLMSLNIGTTLLIGLCMGMLWQSVLLLVVYIPLRRYAGGYHAKTVSRCYLLSVIITVTELLCVKSLTGRAAALLPLGAVAGWMIWRLAPVEHHNKPLSQEEKKLYGQKTRKNLLVVLALAAACVFVYTEISACLVMAETVLCFMLILGKLKNHSYT